MTSALPTLAVDQLVPAATSKSIAILGNAALDIVFTGMPESLIPRTSNICESIQLLPGGSGLNVACAARFFLQKVSLFTRIAPDNASKPLIEECDRRDILLVNLGEPATSNFQTPRIAVYLDKNKERTFVAGDNGGLDLEAHHLKDKLEQISKYDLVAFAGLTPRSGFAFAEMDTIFRELRERNPKIIFVGDVIAMAGLGGKEWRQALDSHLRNYNWFLPSEEELLQLTDDVVFDDELKLKVDDPFSREDPLPDYVRRAEWLMNQFKNLSVVGVKLSADGAIVCRKSDEGVSSTKYQIAYRRDIVDKTGAGDSWVGAFIAGALASIDKDGLVSFDAAAKHGNAAASHCIRYLGATAWCDKVDGPNMKLTIDSIKTESF